MPRKKILAARGKYCFVPVSTKHLPVIRNHICWSWILQNSEWIVFADSLKLKFRKHFSGHEYGKIRSRTDFQASRRRRQDALPKARLSFKSNTGESLSSSKQLFPLGRRCSVASAFALELTTFRGNFPKFWLRELFGDISLFKIIDHMRLAKTFRRVFNRLRRKRFRKSRKAEGHGRNGRKRS